ncbi:hypothetical protein [Pleurocapsa sp. PCC 7319]|uniref:hypothetical protein n=1 Tax=Pleurocapsa sp. PCC 7319 TaxID=118161 RepID=UPI000345D437|nr:hypothetical protein [Pleurocapsa sp. PCC 7319]
MSKIYSGLSILGCAFGSSLMLCLPALADQCSYIKKEQAIATISRLDINQTIYKLCEPCGEKDPQSVKIQHLSMEKVDYQDYWQVGVNGEGIDLAYVFVDSGVEDNLVNLAAIANCPAQSVSPVLSKELIPSGNQEGDTPN